MSGKQNKRQRKLVQFDADKLEESTSWGEVELYRWQYGELPGGNADRPLIYSDALRKAAHAVQQGKVDPFNASEMLKVAGIKLKELGK